MMRTVITSLLAASALLPAAASAQEQQLGARKWAEHESGPVESPRSDAAPNLQEGARQWRGRDSEPRPTAQPAFQPVPEQVSVAQDSPRQWRGRDNGGGEAARPQPAAQPERTPQTAPGGFERGSFGNRGGQPFSQTRQPGNDGFSQRRWGNDDGSNRQAFEPRQPRADYAQPRPAQPSFGDRGTWSGQRRDGQSGEWNRTSRPTIQTFDGNRYVQPRDGRGYGSGYAQPGYGQRGFQQSYGGWNRSWRGDDRFNWSGYRQQNYSRFRLPRYAAPYGWNYGYRRFSIGLQLTGPLFAERYWIEDPYSYRLPPAYGDYRWVRYYGDALLVDLYSGEVVDAVYGIFD